jgi:hypothetical protein
MSFTEEQQRELNDWAKKYDLRTCRYCKGPAEINPTMTNFLMRERPGNLPLLLIVCKTCGHVAHFIPTPFAAGSDEHPILRLVR